MYYRPDEKAACGDVIPFYRDGTWYLFYLKDYRDLENCGEGVPWCLLTTQDLVHFTEHGEVIPRGTPQEQDLYVFTGSCIDAGDKYYIFYTGHNHHMIPAGGRQERILLAESDDLIHWRKCPDFVLDAPEWASCHDFRDPFVFKDPQGGGWCMLLTTVLKNEGGAPLSSNLLGRSKDLTHWEIEDKPFYAPGSYTSPPECPDLFKFGDWWYFLFSEFSDRCVTTYRMSKTPFGPWSAPMECSVDCTALYAAKTAGDDTRRVLFGWNRTKQGNCDAGAGQWGGSIIPHELGQNPDGTLRFDCPAAIRDAYTVPQPVDETGLALRDVTGTAQGWRVGSSGGKSVKLLGTLPSRCRLELEFDTTDQNGEFGLLLRTDPGEPGYALRFEPRYNRLLFWGGVPGVFEGERLCPLASGSHHRLTVIVDGSVLETYVDGAVAQSARMYDRTGSQWGIFANNTTVEFTNITVHTRPED